MQQMNESELQVRLEAFSFETHFDERGAIQWMQENW